MYVYMYVYAYIHIFDYNHFVYLLLITPVNYKLFESSNLSFFVYCSGLPITCLSLIM